MLSVIAAASSKVRTEKVHVEPWVWALILILAGLPALLMGLFGWFRGRSIVPTSLPESLYWKRYRVIRRGSAAFFVAGVLCIIVAVYALSTHDFTSSVHVKQK